MNVYRRCSWCPEYVCKVSSHVCLLFVFDNRLSYNSEEARSFSRSEWPDGRSTRADRGRALPVDPRRLAQDLVAQALGVPTCRTVMQHSAKQDFSSLFFSANTCGGQYAHLTQYMPLPLRMPPSCLIFNTLQKALSRL